MNSAVLFKSDLAETAAKLQTKLLILEETFVGVTTLFRIIPFLFDLLLNAIDDLLDLLDLHMILDDTSTADGFGITKDTGGAAEVFICG